MSNTGIKLLFFVAALYDGVLGLIFLFSPGLAFSLFEVIPPNHFGYVQFPAALLLIFAAMFVRVAMDPVANRFVMLYGVGLKAAYSGLVFYYLVTAGVPGMWVPWAWADLLFLVLFLWAWMSVPRLAAYRET